MLIGKGRGEIHSIWHKDMIRRIESRLEELGNLKHHELSIGADKWYRKLIILTLNGINFDVIIDRNNLLQQVISMNII